MSSKWTVRMKLGTWSTKIGGSGKWAPTLRRESRRRKRLKVELPMYVRPLDDKFADHEDVAEVVDFNSHGIYFTTSKLYYAPGMKLLVTLPYGQNVPVHRKYVGSVVRVEHRWIGSRGVGIKLLRDASDS